MIMILDTTYSNGTTLPKLKQFSPEFLTVGPEFNTDFMKNKTSHKLKPSKKLIQSNEEDYSMHYSFLEF